MYTETVCSQINGVQVVFQNFFLAHDVFQFKCQILLLNLADKAGTGGALLAAVFENVVFYELLGDSAGTLGKASAGKADNACPQNTLQVNSLMCPEAGILNGHKGIDQIFRKLIISDQAAVGSFTDQRLDFISFGVIDGGGQSFGRNVNVSHIRRFGKDPVDCSVQTEAADCGTEDDHKQTKLEHA